MYCPECRVEYREGFTECADCRVPLVAGEPPPEPKENEDPNLSLVTVLESDDRLVLAMAKDSLAEADIPFYVLGEEISPSSEVVTPFLHPWCQVQVAADREAEARALLEALQQLEPAGDSAEEGSPE